MMPRALANALAALSVLFQSALLTFPAIAEELRINKNEQEVAIRGYDTVAYFTRGQAVKGSSEFEHVWQEAKWLFSTADHRDLFAKNPDQYAPHYGGFCAGAMAFGWLAPVDPEAWAIVDNKLYLNFSKAGRDRFAADPGPKIIKADHNWRVLGKRP